MHPRFTVGKNFENNDSALDRYVDRLLLSYVQAGTDKANGVQGFEGEAYWFFGTKHFMLRMLAGAYWAHGTVIPVSQGGSLQSVALEESQHITTGQFQAMLGWRF